MPIEVFSLEEAPGVTLVSAEVMRRLSGTQHPRGPVAIFEIPAPAPLGASSAVVLWGVGDPGNAGTIVRSAAAFGVAVAATEGSVDLWAPKVLRAGAGGHFATSITPDVPRSIDAVRTSGLEIVVTVPSGGAAPAVAEDPFALIIGDEAAGVPADVVAQADRTVSIPMVGDVESLNAAVAASICLYALTGAGNGHG